MINLIWYEIQISIEFWTIITTVYFWTQLVDDSNMDVVSVTLDENEKSFRKHEPEIINLSRHQEIDEILMV